MVAVLLGILAAAPPRALTFDEAVGLAARAPAVAAAAQASETKRVWNRRISRITWNPQLHLQPGWRIEPSNARQPELFFEASQPFSVMGHGSARRRAAHAEAEVLDAESREVALDRHLGAAHAWILVWAAQRVMAAAERQEQVAGELERLVERATQAGALTRADLADARAFHAEARLAVLSAEEEVVERGLDLARETAREPAEMLGASGELPAVTLPEASSRAGLVERASRLPFARKRALEALAERARAVEERAASGSVMSPGVAVQRDAPGGLVVSGVLRATPSLFDRGERERGARLSAADRLDGERREAEHAARVEMLRAIHQVEHAAQVAGALRDDFVPASRDGADTRRRIFQAGEATVLEVLQAERLAIAAENRLHRALAAEAWARIRLAILARAAMESP